MNAVRRQRSAAGGPRSEAGGDGRSVIVADPRRASMSRRPVSLRGRSPRAGMTLFEVIIALAILFGALAVIGQLIATGSRAAVRTEMHSKATLLCQSKLAEVVAGALPLQPAAGLPVDEYHPDWVWSLEVAPGPHPDLLLVAVTVMHLDPARASDSTETLYRYIRRPELHQEWADALAEEAVAAAAAEGTAP